MKQSAIAIAIVLVGCSKESKKEPEPAASKTAEPAPAPKEKEQETGPFAGWDLAARKAALQGAHVTPGDFAGSWQAWNVAGDKVTIWDGKAEKQLALALLSPCEVKTTETLPDGATTGTVSHFTLKDGAIVMGLGDAGSRRGGEAIACVSNKVFTVDAKGACSEWEASMFDDGKYEQAPGTCGFRKEGDKEVFFAQVHGHETVLEVHGDALLSEQLARVHSEKVADFAAAKTARDGKR